MEWILGVNDNVDTSQWALPFLDSEFKFEKIDEEDVLKLLRGLDVNKAVGLDNISAAAQDDCSSYLLNHPTQFSQPACQLPFPS